MKQKVLFALVVCLCAAGSIINIHLAHNDRNMNFSLEGITMIAHAGPEGCTINPTDLQGVCKLNVSGEYWNCVSASWWETRNCTSD